MGKTIHLDEKCQKNASLGFCKLCDKTFRIDGGGISQVTSHASGQLHLQCEKASQNQSMISVNPSSVSTITKPKVVFSSKESIINAEILQALKTVGSNFCSLQFSSLLHLLQLMAMENYSEKCSQIQILLKDKNKAKRKLNILFNLGLLLILCNPSKMIFLIEHFHLSLIRQQHLRWNSNMMALYNIGWIPWNVLWCCIVDHSLFTIYEIFATYLNGWSKCKPKISKAVYECWCFDQY